MKPNTITLTALLMGSFIISLYISHQHKNSSSASNSERYVPPPVSNEMVRASICDELEVIISDVVIPPNKTVPRHYYPGEFIYIIEGSTVHIEEDKPNQILKAGDTYVIPPEMERSPRGGSQGARAIVFRVRKER